jgi:NAD(P)-dependent dehydrogenase (short-subunit alcohol dehydrogenase family)
VLEIEPETFEHILAVNLTGAFLAARAAIPAMQRRGGGNIIFIASQLAHVASPGRPGYCASKGGMLQLAKVLAVDHAADKIRVNTLSPGGVATVRLERRYGSLENARAVMDAKHPLGRIAEPVEVARAALFLASSDSSFMTGADLLLDGGYCAV